jgi:hypothetical protein
MGSQTIRKYNVYPECTNFPKAKARPGSLVASAKSWPLMVKSPMARVSWETKPSMEPEPYWIENSEPLALYDEDALESNLAWRKHAIEVHCVLGTQRLLDLGCNISDISLQTRHYNIPSVQDDFELLRRSAEFDLREILGIHEIYKSR